MSNWYKTAITLREVIDKVSPNDRITMSRNDTLEIKDVSGSQQPGMKPRGLWYAIGSEWLEFVNREFSSGFGKYIYKIDINPSSMLMINDSKKFIDFSEEYKVKDEISEMMGRAMSIDWSLVAQRYSGIEIAPYFSAFRMSDVHAWYYGWDIASGCIWRGDALVDSELIYSDVEFSGSELGI